MAGATDSDVHRRRVERLAEGVRPVRHAVSGSLAPGLRRPGADLVHADDGEDRAARTLRTRRRTFSASSSRPRVGPSRNFSAPDATASHTYTFPAGWTKSGTVRIGEPPGRPPAPALRRAPCVPGHRPEHGRRLRHGLRRPGRRLPVRRREAGDEVLARVVPRHERGRLHRPLGWPSLLHLRRQDPDLRAASCDARSARRTTVTRSRGPGEMLAWTGDYDPAIEGHGTLTASNIVGQGVINGLRVRRPSQRLAPAAPTPAPSSAALRRRSSRRSATSTSRFDFSTQLGYLLADAARGRRDVELVRRVGTPTTTARTRRARKPTSSTTGTARPPLFSTGNGAPGFGTATAAAAVGRDRASAPPRSSAGPAGTRSTNDEPDHRQRRDGLVEPRAAGATGSQRCGRRRRRRLLAPAT